LSLRGRTAERAAAIRSRAERFAERAEAERSRHRSVDAAYMAAGHDIEIGGGIMAGALAYRIFIWLLPFALVVIGGIGVASDVQDESTQSAASSLGLSGVVSNSVAHAARGSSRWYALLIGIPILLWATRSLLKALIVVHRLVWRDERRPAQKATLGGTVFLLAVLAGYFAFDQLMSSVGSWSAAPVEMAVRLAGFFAWWLLISAWLPHGDAPLRALVPGAAIAAVGFELIELLARYLVSPRVASSESAYGVLGVAAALLFALYVVSRLIVLSAVVNATTWAQDAQRG
jgi:uncharacterized BrkB/YihY/UPF0761 family membrane protein